MGAEIERIVDRKTVRNRVQYLVVWRGFGEESNTWESRMDLVADGYSDVIREYENGRKDADAAPSSASSSSSATRSPSRGRSPGRAKSPAKSPTKSPGRPRGRPRSDSTGRSPSASRGSSRRRSSSKGKAAATTNGNGTDTESTPSRRRSSRQQEKMVSTVHIDALAKSGDDDLLRKALAALDHPGSEAKQPHAASPAATGGKKTTVSLAYEESTTSEKNGTVTSSSSAAPKSPSKSPAKAKALDADAAPGFQDLWNKLNEGNWLLWFLSVVVIAASLLASQFLPDASDDQVGGVAPAVGDVEAAQAITSQWRLWLPFLTPIVALLLVFNQRDERALVKWIAIALSWRVAAELSMFFEFAQVAIGAVSVSYTALVVALVSIARSDDLRSKSTLILFVTAALALALSDSWIVQTQNVVLSSRVNLMSASALAIALSPVLTAMPDED